MYSLLSSSIDGNVILWDVESGLELKRFRGHTGLVHAAYFSSTGETIVTSAGSGDLSIKLWNADTAMEILSLDRCAGCNGSASLSPDGSKILSPSKKRRELRIWDAYSGDSIVNMQGHGDRIKYAIFFADGTRVLSSSDDRTCRIWDSVTGECLHVISLVRYRMVHNAFINKSENVIVTLQDNFFSSWIIATDGTKRIECVWAIDFHGHQRQIRTVAWSDDETKIVSASDDNTARVWDMATGVQLLTLPVHVGGVSVARFVSGDTQVLTTDREGAARIWCVATGNILQQYNGNRGAITCADVCYNEKDEVVVVCGDKSGFITMWNGTTGRPLLELGAHTRSITHLCIKSNYFDYVLK